MQVGDEVTIGQLQGKILAIAEVGAEKLCQVQLQLPYTGWYPSEIVTDTTPPQIAPPAAPQQTPAAKPAPAPGQRR